MITGIGRTLRLRQDREHLAVVRPVAAHPLHPRGEPTLVGVLDAVARVEVDGLHRLSLGGDPVGDDRGDRRDPCFR